MTPMWPASVLLAIAFVAGIVGAYDAWCELRAWVYWSRVANESRLPVARVVK